MKDLPDSFQVSPREFDSHLRIGSGPLRIAARTFKLMQESFYDFNLFRRHSSTIRRGDTREKHIALITMAYHSLEKGLSLRAPRPGFGLRHVSKLINRVSIFMRRYGPDRHCLAALAVLNEYLEFNRRHGLEMPRLRSAVRDLELSAKEFPAHAGSAGARVMTRDEFYGAAKMDLRDFFDARCSVRQYADKAVERETIAAAVKMAQKAPCVCNRQSGRVKALLEKEGVKTALEIQGGAAGFAEAVPAVLIISSDISSFQSAGERYQGWIDGGLFAMSLIYALHSLGLVTCCLNWSKGRATDQLLRSRMNIPDNEAVIMLLAVGHPLEEFQVAASWRRPLDEVLEFDAHS